MTVLVLDTDGVSKLAAPSGRARLRALLELTGDTPVVPAAVLSECVTGDPRRDYHVDRLIKVSRVIDVGAVIGRVAGLLRARALASVPEVSGVDAMVAAVADGESDRDAVVIVTSDSRDLSVLASFGRNPHRITISGA